MRRTLGNAVVRARRDLRFVLVDRYRALLASRYVALTSLAAAVVDRTVASRHRLRRRGKPLPDGPRLVRVTLGAGDVLSVVVAGAPAGALTLRRGSRNIDLHATTDVGDTTTRYVATLTGGAADAADGTDWTVAVGAAGLVVTDPSFVPRGLGVTAGLLVLHGPRASAAGIEHTLEVGVRTAVVRWSGAGTQLTVGGIAHPVVGGAAEIDLAAVEPGAVLVDGAPLVLRGGRWATDARPAAPPPVRVVAPDGRRLEIGYDADGRLEVKTTPAAAAAWS